MSEQAVPRDPLGEVQLRNRFRYELDNLRRTFGMTHGQLLDEVAGYIDAETWSRRAKRQESHDE